MYCKVLQNMRIYYKSLLFCDQYNTDNESKMHNDYNKFFLKYYTDTYYKYQINCNLTYYKS